MQRLLLCFIHGFKSDDGAFYDFPLDLQQSLLEENPALNVEIAIYPTYETKGDLPQSVSSFQEWLLKRRADNDNGTAEERNGNESSSGVILIAHSMGGLVAADAFLSIVDSRNNLEKSKREPIEPQILGILAFDTPFCGLSRSMFAYGAFAQYQTVSSVYNLATSLSALALPTASNTVASETNISESASDRPAWKLWQMVAMRTGAAGAIGAAGAAAYMNREQIGKGLSYLNKESIQYGLSSMNMNNVKQALSMVSRDNIEQGLSYMSRENIGNGFAWLTSHLRFVSHLMKGEELRHRIKRLTAMKGVGFANLYTSLGENGFWGGGYFVAERTFCAIPDKSANSNKPFIREVNPKAKDEVDAHVHMFEPNKNLGYEEMLRHAKGLVLNWAVTYSGMVVDEHVKEQTSEALKPRALTRKDRSFTRYSYSDTSGFREVGDEFESNNKDNRWSDGLSVPRYVELKKYIPSSFGTSNFKMKGTEEKTAPQYTSYYYDEAGSLGKIEGATDTTLEASECDPSSSECNDIASQQDVVAETNIETNEDTVQIDTEHVPGVTEDLEFEGKEELDICSSPAPMDAIADGPTHGTDKEPGYVTEENIETKSPPSEETLRRRGSRMEETYESFPSVETPCYETFSPLQSNPTLPKKRWTTDAIPHSNDAVIRRDYAPLNTKARPEQILKLEPDEAPKTTATERAPSGAPTRTSEMMNGTSNVHVNAQRPPPNRRRSELWNRWRRLSSQNQLQTTAGCQKEAFQPPENHAVQEKPLEKSASSSWQWQPWRWSWRRQRSMTKSES